VARGRYEEIVGSAIMPSLNTDRWRVVVELRSGARVIGDTMDRNENGVQVYRQGQPYGSRIRDQLIAGFRYYEARG
jgi:hypothetical protein